MTYTADTPNFLNRPKGFKKKHASCLGGPMASFNCGLVLLLCGCPEIWFYPYASCVSLVCVVSVSRVEGGSREETNVKLDQKKEVGSECKVTVCMQL